MSSKRLEVWPCAKTARWLRHSWSVTSLIFSLTVNVPSGSPVYFFPGTFSGPSPSTIRKPLPDVKPPHSLTSCFLTAASASQGNQRIRVARHSRHQHRREGSRAPSRFQVFFGGWCPDGALTQPSDSGGDFGRGDSTKGRAPDERGRKNSPCRLRKLKFRRTTVFAEKPPGRRWFAHFKL